MPRPVRQKAKHPALKRLGDRVRDLRGAMQPPLSQEALADEVGIARSYMSGIERGQRNVSYLLLLQLAKALRISPSDLL